MLLKGPAMKKTINHLVLSTLALFTTLASLAQQADTVKPKTQFKLSVNYNSNLNYYGRVDSIKSSGVFPMAELWFTPKVYVNAAPIFVNNPLQSMVYAGTVATAGYLNVSSKWLTSFSFLKPFYTEQARLVQSALKAQGSAL